MARSKKRKKRFPWVLVIVVLIIAVAGYLKFGKKDVSSETTYEYAELELMDMESIVSSTGTMEAVGTVEVGTQVSGMIDSIMVDFNDHVVKDQVLAILDRTTLKSSYRDAQANLRRAQAQYELAQLKFENDDNLFAKNLISSYEHQSTKTDLVNAETSVVSAEISLEKADQNLNDYAIIRSPIDGLVISREIEEGQTVQASMSSPTLFVLAEDLQNMEIDAIIDESDIGSIEQGQAIRFEVEAYPDEEFTGTVSQMRLQAQTVSDVVHYTVICKAENVDDMLLPGMTATIDFIVDYREQVNAVANSALNISMPESVVAEMQEKMMERMKSRPEGSGEKRERSGAMSQNTENMGKLWYKTEDGEFGMAIALKGMSDGINTEILEIKRLPDNAQIITKVSTTESTSSSSDMPRGMMRGGPGLF